MVVFKKTCLALYGADIEFDSNRNFTTVPLCNWDVGLLYFNEQCMQSILKGQLYCKQYLALIGS